MPFIGKRFNNKQPRCERNGEFNVKIKIPGDGLVQIFSSGGRSIYVPGGGGAINIFTSGVKLPLLLYISGAATWPITDGLAGVGAGLTMLDAGSWGVAGGYVLNTPVAVLPEIVVNGTFSSDTGWTHSAAWTLGGAVAVCDGTTTPLYQDIIKAASFANKWYQAAFDIVSRTAGSIRIELGDYGMGPNVSIAASYVHTIKVDRAVGNRPLVRSTLFNGSIGNLSVKRVPNSSLFANVQLSTTDVLAEEVIHAMTLGTQVGMAMNLDRSFAAKAEALASTGQAVLSLKEVTGVSGVGLAATDGLIVNGVSYTLTVTGAGTVAYNDSLKTQTVVLSANLGADVAADAKVGLDWASWNGVLCYFDGAGNVKVDEVKAGVYTNRISVAVAFAADKVLSLQKVAATYTLKFDGATKGTTALIDAAAMAGQYVGMFFTYPLNTITYLKVAGLSDAGPSYAVITEDGFFLLLENSDYILLEA